MTEETGLVIGATGNTVRVRIDRDSRCAGCHSCFVNEGEGALVTTAHDPLHVRVGDRVKLEERAIGGRRLSSGKAGLLLFGLPLLAFFPGFIGAQALGRFLGLASPAALGLPGGLIGLAIPLLVLYLRRGRSARKGDYGLEVVGVLGRRLGPEEA